MYKNSLELQQTDVTFANTFEEYDQVMQFSKIFG